MNVEKREMSLSESLLGFCYLVGLLAFAFYVVNIYKTGVAVGLFHLGPDMIKEFPNAIKWVIGAFAALFLLTWGGTGMWCLALYLGVNLAAGTGDAGALLWLAAAIGGFYAQAMGRRIFSSLFLRDFYEQRALRASKERTSPVNTAAGITRKPALNPKAFDGLIGVEKAVQEFKDALELPVLHPELVKEYKLEPTKGVILYGPPGTGKTSLARAVASYFNVPFINKKSSELCGDRYVGTAEASVRELFRGARRRASEEGTRAIVFVDEIDAVARKRDGSHMNRPSDLVLNGLLEELDGFDKDPRVLLIAATNRFDVLDEAILRPGRLDKHIKLGYPDRAARVKLFKLFLAGIPLCEDDEITQRFDAVMEECADRRARVSPAEIKEICECAKKRAVRRGLKAQEAETKGVKAEDMRGVMEEWVSTELQES